MDDPRTEALQWLTQATEAETRVRLAVTRQLLRDLAAYRSTRFPAASRMTETTPTTATAAQTASTLQKLLAEMADMSVERKPLRVTEATFEVLKGVATDRPREAAEMLATFGTAVLVVKDPSTMP